VIDPHNDFISEGGKVWDRLKAQRLDEIERFFVRAQERIEQATRRAGTVDNGAGRSRGRVKK
jgi:hypothetical protein